MKPAVLFTAVSVVALAAAGLGRLNAATEADQASADADKAPTEISETVSGGATVAQDADMSQDGLAAMSAIHLARVAINDGYVDSAKKLLDEAHKLLGQVSAEDKPVTVTTEVKVGDKTTKKETVTTTPDLIPILTELQVVEGFAPDNDQAANEPQAAAQMADQATPDAAKASTEPQHSRRGTKSADKATQASQEDRMAAVGKAREQLSQGDRQGAIDTLHLVDLSLVTRTLSMPLEETAAHVDKAKALLDDGKLHEANLELKQARDELVTETVVMAEPVTPADAQAVADSADGKPAAADAEAKASAPAPSDRPAIAHAK